MGAPTAVNPTTGERVQFVDGKWAPVAAHPVAEPTPTAPVTPAAPSTMQQIQSAVAGGVEALGSGDPTHPDVIPQAIARDVAPVNSQQATQAAIDAAMMLPMSEFSALGKLVKPLTGVSTKLGAIARLGMRVGVPAAAGGVASAASGKDFSSGAGQGAGEALGTELVGAGLGTARKGLSTMDASRVGNWISKRFPALGKVASVVDFDRLFRGGEAVEKQGAKLKAVETQVANTLGNTKIQISPEHAEQIEKLMPGKWQNLQQGRTFKEMTDEIKQLNDLGWSLHGDPKTTMAGRQIREFAHQATEDLGKALDAHTPGLGKKYLTSRREYGAVKELSNLLGNSKLYNNGKLDMGELQKAAQDPDFRQGLARVIPKADVDKFLSEVHRGAPPVATDVKGSIGVRLHPPAGLSLHPPTIAQHIGEVPVKTTGALATLMAYGLPRVIGESLNPAPEGAAASPLPAH